jgi:HEAT repeat protein
VREFRTIPPGSRTLAIDVLGRVRSLTAVPLLRDLLRDENADIRARAADALGQIGDPNNAPQLMDALEDDSWQVRAIAAKALGRLPGTESVEALCRALTDAQWWVRANAAEALKAKGEPGHRALLGMLDSDDMYAREQAVFMLEESGVLDTYLDQLNSKKEEDRRQALAFIQKLVKLERTERLTEAAHRHPDRNVRDDLWNLLGLQPADAEGAS